MSPTSKVPYYLAPGFPVKTLTIATLKQIFQHHHISYAGCTLKAHYLQLFDRVFMPEKASSSSPTTVKENKEERRRKTNIKQRDNDEGDSEREKRHSDDDEGLLVSETAPSPSLILKDKIKKKRVHPPQEPKPCGNDERDSDREHQYADNDDKLVPERVSLLSSTLKEKKKKKRVHFRGEPTVWGQEDRRGNSTDDEDEEQDEDQCNTGKASSSPNLKEKNNKCVRFQQELTVRGDHEHGSKRAGVDADGDADEEAEISVPANISSLSSLTRREKDRKKRVHFQQEPKVWDQQNERGSGMKDEDEDGDEGLLVFEEVLLTSPSLTLKEKDKRKKHLRFQQDPTVWGCEKERGSGRKDEDEDEELFGEHYDIGEYEDRYGGNISNGTSTRFAKCSYTTDDDNKPMNNMAAYSPNVFLSSSTTPTPTTYSVLKSQRERAQYQRQHQRDHGRDRRPRSPTAMPFRPLRESASRCSPSRASPQASQPQIRAAHRHPTILPPTPPQPYPPHAHHLSQTTTTTNTIPSPPILSVDSLYASLLAQGDALSFLEESFARFMRMQVETGAKNEVGSDTAMLLERRNDRVSSASAVYTDADISMDTNTDVDLVENVDADVDADVSGRRERIKGRESEGAMEIGRSGGSGTRRSTRSKAKTKIGSGQAREIGWSHGRRLEI